MFNLIDVIVIAVLFLSAFIGYKRGFVKTIIGFASFFVALGVAMMFYKPLGIILTEKTTIDEWIVENLERINSKESGDSTEIVPQEQMAENSSKELSLTDAFNKLPGALVEKIDFEDTKAKVKHEIATKVSELIMNLLSLISIFLVVKVTLFIAELLLGGLVKMPVLKQINEILGMSLGAIMGFVEIYVAFAVITFISSITDILFIVDAIKSSAFASALFENNLLIKLLF